MNNQKPICYAARESFPVYRGAAEVYLVTEEGFDGCSMPLYAEPLDSQETVDNLLLWQNSAAAVMARFINLSAYPDSLEWGKTAFDAALLLNTGVKNDLS